MPKKTLEAIEGVLRDYALGFPEAHEDHPWGHIAVKVKGKAAGSVLVRNPKGPAASGAFLCRSPLL